MKISLFNIYSQEFNKKDPFLERRLFFITFIYLCADTVSLAIYALPLSFMLAFTTSVKGYGFFSLWLIAAWQTDNGSLMLSNFLLNKTTLTISSPKKTWEGISGGIFLRFFLYDFD